MIKIHITYNMININKIMINYNFLFSYKHKFSIKKYIYSKTSRILKINLNFKIMILTSRTIYKPTEITHIQKGNFIKNK